MAIASFADRIAAMSGAAGAPSSPIFTLGHSNHIMQHFLSLLTSNRIELLVDTRSSPYSRFAPQFNMDALRPALQNGKIGYLYLGRELGGRPDGAEYYDADGHVLY